ncbi:helix-turn-helix domain-containing protein [Pseudoalteromonas simplex]|uniref:helix-turn-helix domain-containing protein n=1 Tax=Pseudoalteromonas simplex TaxID=2783613 RepID=UPI001887D188|nr:helix-turn-helix transcriptional regulator [Pseudoalteromonas sp. A520]
MSIRLWLEKGLKENNLTVAGLARKSSVSVSTLYRLKLYDYRFPSSKIMQKLEKVLGVYSKEEFKLGETLTWHFTDDYEEVPIEQLTLNKQNHRCAVCQTILDGKKTECFIINLHRMKNYPEGASREVYADEIDTEEPYVVTCEDCSHVFEEVMNYTYPEMLKIIMAPGPSPITFFSKELNKDVAITNQSLLAERLHVNQSTISRIISEKRKKRESQSYRSFKIDLIGCKLAISIHVLCAERRLEQSFEPGDILDKTISKSRLRRELTENFKYPDDHLISDYAQKIKGTDFTVKCDLMVLDEQFEKLAACFIADITNEKSEHAHWLDALESVSRKEYIGLALCMRVKFIIIQVIDSSRNTLFPLSELIIYEIHQANYQITISLSGFREFTEPDNYY